MGRTDGQRATLDAAFYEGSHNNGSYSWVYLITKIERKLL